MITPTLNRPIAAKSGGAGPYAATSAGVWNVPAPEGNEPLGGYVRSIGRFPVVA